MSGINDCAVVPFLSENIQGQPARCGMREVTGVSFPGEWIKDYYRCSAWL